MANLAPSQSFEVKTSDAFPRPLQRAAHPPTTASTSPTGFAAPQSMEVKTGDSLPSQAPLFGYSSSSDPLTARRPSGSETSMPSLKRKESEAASAKPMHHGFRSALGLEKEAPIAEEHDLHPHQENLWPRIRLILREPFAEFWGVFIFVMFGNGSVAQTLLSEHVTSAPGGQGYGSYQSIAWGWGLGIMLGIYVAGESGAFLNPAVTFAFCVYRGLPFRRWPIYLIAQFLGGFLASGVVYANYLPAVINYAGGVGIKTVPPASDATAQIFCTFPAAFLSKGQQFVSEFIASSILMFVIFALKDDSNLGAALGSKNWFPLCLFFLIYGIGACFGYETGYAINVARDFAPRVMAYIIGYHDVFTAGDYYFWVPIVASFTGCLFGGGLYDLFIYTGPESPINSPYLGLPYLLNPFYGLEERKKSRIANPEYAEKSRPMQAPGEAFGMRV